MAGCIFCEIGKKKIPTRIVYEDEKALAFLDITPRSKGMCLVIPKKHIATFDEDMELAGGVFNAAMVVGKKLKAALEPLAVFFSAMQAQVPHFHLRVYPVYEDQIPLVENKPIEIKENELDELAKKINAVEIEVEEKPEPEPVKKEELKKVDKKKSGEDKFWLRRHQEVA